MVDGVVVILGVVVVVVITPCEVVVVVVITPREVVVEEVVIMELAGPRRNISPSPGASLVT